MARRQSSSALADSATVFAALGDQTRLRLVSRLCTGGPMSVCRLAEEQPISRQAVSKHLRALEHAGLVRSSRYGRERIWELRPSRLDAVRKQLGEISAQWDRAISRLRTMVEERE